MFRRLFSWQFVIFFFSLFGVILVSLWLNPTFTYATPVPKSFFSQEVFLSRMPVVALLTRDSVRTKDFDYKSMYTYQLKAKPSPQPSPTNSLEVIIPEDVDKVPTPTPSPARVPSPSQSIIDCVGPDGKHFSAKRQACDTFNGRFIATPTPKPVSAPGSGSTVSIEKPIPKSISVPPVPTAIPPVSEPTIDLEELGRLADINAVCGLNNAEFDRVLKEYCPNQKEKFPADCVGDFNSARRDCPNPNQ